LESLGRVIDLEEFESRLTVRPLAPEDYEKLVELGRKCFPGMAT
jgi:hypothetical protein